jgi:hypothetical protein
MLLDGLQLLEETVTMIIKGILTLTFIVGFVTITSPKVGYFWALVAVFTLFFAMRSMKKKVKG